jgi:hypothetical protein
LQSCERAPYGALSGFADPLPMKRRMRPRWLLFAAASGAVVALDFLVKATVPTLSTDAHARSFAWSLLTAGLVAALAALVVLPSRLAAAASGVTAGAVLGNLVSAARHSGAVPNPLVAGGFAFNVADVVLLGAVPVLVVALARVAIVHRATIDRAIPPRRWELALRL